MKVDSVLDAGPGVPGSIPCSAKSLVFRNILDGLVLDLENKGSPPIELPSLWGTRVLAENLLIIQLGKC